MARVPPGEWVPHVEAYVDVSRPAPPRNTYGLPLLSPRLPFSAQVDSLSLQLGFSQLYVHSTSVVAAVIRGYFGYSVSTLAEKISVSDSV